LLHSFFFLSASRLHAIGAAVAKHRLENWDYAGQAEDQKPLKRFTKMMMVVMDSVITRSSYCIEPACLIGFRRPHINPGMKVFCDAGVSPARLGLFLPTEDRLNIESCVSDLFRLADQPGDIETLWGGP